MNILIVDDHATNRKLLRAQLEFEGLAVREAADGVEALAMLEREPVDAIISDILMPRMDGFRLCREVRQSEKFCALPFLLYTSTYDSLTDRQLGDTVEADGYIVKPAATAAILEALHEAAQKLRERTPQQAQPPNELYVLKQYNQVLVNKLEKKKSELEETLAKLRVLHEESLELNRDLARSNNELEQFAYVASHDLQEPLRAVGGCVQLLKQRYQSQIDSAADELIMYSVEGVRRMQGLIDDLLTYSRLETRGNRLEPTDYSVVLKHVLDNLQAAIRESGARVTAGGEFPTVNGDATQLTQLLQNLIGNAIKYRDKRSPEIHVGVTCGGNEWLFSVRDNGIGIEPQYYDRIFKVFQRLHPRREYAGNGIGLSLCKKIVERHGGRIWVESQPGEGSTFYFTISKKEMNS